MLCTKATANEAGRDGKPSQHTSDPLLLTRPVYYVLIFTTKYVDILAVQNTDDPIEFIFKYFFTFQL